MRLDQLLVHKKLCESREEAKKCIALGDVFVDGENIQKQTRQFSEESVVIITSRPKFVSRGGDKLEDALNHVYGSEAAVRAFIANKEVLDVGSSTGGFTDCVLSYGAKHVTAVDVGTMQFHHRLREDTRITLYENTDIRKFASDKKFDVIVADVSFISLEKILDIILSFGAKEVSYFLLIKPQFEVGFGNTKKGIVKDMQLVEDVLKNYTKLAEGKNCTEVSIFPCSITGGDGNQEYFLYAKK
jgi:23S rRNA (cytidine1920-2'-O)/16S rRNA (cytidine1409-2'-O)-methyltransferase